MQFCFCMSVVKVLGGFVPLRGVQAVYSYLLFWGHVASRWICLIFCDVLVSKWRGKLPVWFSPPFPFPSPLPFLPVLPLEVRPLNPARSLGERCRLPQRGLGRSLSRNRTWCILAYLLATVVIIFLIINLPDFVQAYRYDSSREGSDGMIFTRPRKCRYGIPSHTVRLRAWWRWL